MTLLGLIVLDIGSAACGALLAILINYACER